MANKCMSFASPIVIYVYTTFQKASEWQTVFWIAAGVYCVGALLFCLFLDDQQQPWAVDENILDKQEVTMDKEETPQGEHTSKNEDSGTENQEGETPSHSEPL